MGGVATHTEIESSWTYDVLLEAVIVAEYKEAYQYTQIEHWEDM